jgi:hypothetical protein
VDTILAACMGMSVCCTSRHVAGEGVGPALRGSIGSGSRSDPEFI